MVNFTKSIRALTLKMRRWESGVDDFGIKGVTICIIIDYWWCRTKPLFGNSDVEETCESKTSNWFIWSDTQMKRCNLLWFYISLLAESRMIWQKLMKKIASFGFVLSTCCCRRRRWMPGSILWLVVFRVCVFLLALCGRWVTGGLNPFQKMLEKDDKFEALMFYYFVVCSQKLWNMPLWHFLSFHSIYLGPLRLDGPDLLVSPHVMYGPWEEPNESQGDYLREREEYMRPTGRVTLVVIDVFSLSPYVGNYLLIRSNLSIKLLVLEYCLCSVIRKYQLRVMGFYHSYI